MIHFICQQRVLSRMRKMKRLHSLYKLFTRDTPVEEKGMGRLKENRWKLINNMQIPFKRKLVTLPYWQTVLQRRIIADTEILFSDK